MSLRCETGSDAAKCQIVEMNCACAGQVRRKVQRTTYNEKGEEVTEMVYEDGEPEPVAAPAEKVSHCTAHWTVDLGH